MLDHGRGGRALHSLIIEIILKYINNPILADLNDSAVFDIKAGRMAFSTDSYIVDPLFFSGGDIGDLSINGTVNDLAMLGARPLYLSVGFILEKGFPIFDLGHILAAMKIKFLFETWSAELASCWG